MFSVPEEESAVETVADSVLAGRLRAIFANVEGLEALSVAVTEGVVRLGGPVEQPEDRRRAEEITSSLRGVVYVVNRIEAAASSAWPSASPFRTSSRIIWPACC